MSGRYLRDVGMAPSSQALEPPQFPGRFRSRGAEGMTTCPICLSILEPASAACVLCGEPTYVDQGELAYHAQCMDEVLHHGQEVVEQ